MSPLILIILLTTSAFARLEKIHIKNLDLIYAIPEGRGVLEKFTIGVSKIPDNLPVEIFRREATMDIYSPFVEFQYVNPIPFVHNLKALETKVFHLNIDEKEHYLKNEFLRFTPEKMGEFFLQEMDFNCQGTSILKDPLERLQEDCRTKMKGTIAHMNLPFEVLKAIASKLPDEATESPEEMPVHDLSIKVDQGDIFAYVRIKYIVRAYLKVWGFVQYADGGKTIGIRLDTVKFGILNVTNLVMNELQKIESESVSVNPPWITIKLGKK